MLDPGEALAGMAPHIEPRFTFRDRFSDLAPSDVSTLYMVHVFGMSTRKTRSILRDFKRQLPAPEGFAKMNLPLSLFGQYSRPGRIGRPH